MGTRLFVGWPDADLPHPTHDHACRATSRIIVKNLPKYLTEERLKEHFAKQGEVTDVRLMRNEAGESRRFGFVGFRTPKEATAAVRFFNDTFIDTSHITVDYAKTVGDGGLSRPWSKYSKDSSAHAIKEKKNEASVQLSEQKMRLREQVLQEKKRKEELLSTLYKGTKAVKEDTKLGEYLSVMAPRTQKTVWENDDPTIKKSAVLQLPFFFVCLNVLLGLAGGQAKGRVGQVQEDWRRWGVPHKDPLDI